MERLVITIHPSPGHEGLLLVADAMQQVIDLIKLHDEAAKALGGPQGGIEWRLEQASANSPFTVTAIAEPTDPTIDITVRAKRVKNEVNVGLQGLISDKAAPPWMGVDAMRLARSLFARNQNGISKTEIVFGADARFSITQAEATSAMDTISAVAGIALPMELEDRVAFGEIEGTMVAAGRYFNKPAIQIRTDLYDVIWCVLSESTIEKFGDEHTMRDIWEGHHLGVQGRLLYAKNGKLRIEADSIREIAVAPFIDLDSVLDPGFTSGLDPVEYLRQFHDGELA